MAFVSQTQDRLTFAVPKKGRLQQSTLLLLEGSDIQFRREARNDIALVKNLPLALIFLPAADIPTFVGEGSVDLGITGLDQVKEHDAQLIKNKGSASRSTSEGVDVLMDLGFGKCKLQVQVPEKGKIQQVQELLGKNIVTSFVGLTEQYFRNLEEKTRPKTSDLDSRPSPLVQGENSMQTRIQYVGGSVEAACALGVGDGIVDLVESGETMKAAGLKAIETVLESTAVLIKSKRPSNQALVDIIAQRIQGVITAQRWILCQYNVPRKLLSNASAVTPGKRAPTVTALEDTDWVAVSSMVEKDKIADAMDRLILLGATDILCINISNSRT